MVLSFCSFVSYILCTAVFSSFNSYDSVSKSIITATLKKKLFPLCLLKSF